MKRAFIKYKRALMLIRVKKPNTSRIKRLKFWMFFFTLISLDASATIYDPYISKCSISKHNNAIPPSPQLFNKLNNLDQNIEQLTEEVNNKELVVFQGRLLDDDCVPISDAIISIWEDDSETEQFSSSKLMPLDILVNKISKHTATAISDNLGNFTFIAKKTNLPQNIRLKITHFYFSPFNFTLPAKDMVTNMDTNQFEPPINKDDNVFHFDITVSELNKYRSF